jgi:nucleotide-binding universal stress UspA family protein
MFTRIVATTDFSESAEQSWRVAIELARVHRAELILLHVFVELPLYADVPAATVLEVYEEQRRWVQDELDARVRPVAAEGVTARVRLETGQTAETITRVAEEERADLVVAGTHGRSGLDRVFVGSVAERVVRTAPCPVLVVRPRKAAAGQAKAA